MVHVTDEHNNVVKRQKAVQNQASHKHVFVFKEKTAYEVRIGDWSSTCALPICWGNLWRPVASCGILWLRSEERRVGKECRSRRSPYH